MIRCVISRCSLRDKAECLSLSPKEWDNAMNIVATTLALNVGDVAASSMFFTTHLGFREALSHEDFVALSREDGAAPTSCCSSARPRNRPAPGSRM